MSREDFEKRLYISYLDEVTVYSFKDVIYHAVVSMISIKKNYIDNIKTDWAKLRKDFNIGKNIEILPILN